jgi:hypothetical protein
MELSLVAHLNGSNRPGLPVTLTVGTFNDLLESLAMKLKMSRYDDTEFRLFAVDGTELFTLDETKKHRVVYVSGGEDFCATTGGAESLSVAAIAFSPPEPVPVAKGVVAKEAEPEVPFEFTVAQTTEPEKKKSKKNQEIDWMEGKFCTIFHFRNFIDFSSQESMKI